MAAFDDYNPETDIQPRKNGHPPVQPEAASESLTLQQTAAQTVQAEYVELYQSGAGSVKADEVHLQDSSAGIIAADQADIQASQIGAVVADTAVVTDSHIGLLIANKVEGQVSTLIDGRSAAIIGGLVALGIGLAGAALALVLRGIAANDAV